MVRIALALLLLLLAITGCSHPRHGLDACLIGNQTPSTREETVYSLRYRVRTDAGKPAAHEVDRFMERAAALWTPLFGVPDPLALPLEIRLYRAPADLARLLTSQKLSAAATGLYLPTSSPAIHVACQGDEPGHPYRTLLHEGTHQFIHLGAGYREPGRGSATSPRLALPLWLSEGLACYYEAAFVTPDLLQAGRPDPARLSELQNALRHGKVASLDDLLARRYGEPFTSLDYAIAWGVVYALMQDSPPPWANGGREWLKSLLAEAKSGWPAPAGSAASAPVTGRDAQWWATVTDRTRIAFNAFATGHGLTIPAWEAQWRDWILAHP